MKKLSTRIISILLTVCILSANIVFASDEKHLTRGEALALILQGADAYSPNISENDIIKGYPNGKKHLSNEVTRSEALVMLSRAFSKLPKLDQDDLRNGIFDNKFNDVPQWASDSINLLNSIGILNESSEDLLNSDELITENELRLLLLRLYAVYGTEKKDDFYSNINNNYLKDLQIPQGYGAVGAASDMASVNSLNLFTIINESIDQNSEKGSDAQKIGDFYKSFIDIDARNKNGIGVLKEYFDKIDNAKNIVELIDVDSFLEKEYGLGMLMTWSTMADLKDSTVNVFYFNGLNLRYDKDYYLDETQIIMSEYKKMLKKYLVILGKTEEIAEKDAKNIYDFEVELSKSTYSLKESQVLENIYNPVKKDELISYYKGVNFNEVLKKYGFDNIETFILMDKNKVKKCGELLNNDNLEVLKDSIKLGIIINLSSFLTEEIEQVATDFSNAVNGISGKISLAEKAVSVTQQMISTPMEKVYSKRFFSEEAKKDVEKMVKEFIEVYKDKLKANTWLSEQTKKMAIKKLETMNIKIAYPDVWENDFDNIEISCDNLLENILNINSNFYDSMLAKIGKPVSKDDWQMTVYTVNAYYDATKNEIVFPAGILQAPMYDYKNSRVENLAAIGSIIAHEISHAFDNNGAKMDENGNMNNWWTEEDYTKFNEKCNSVIEFYDGVEIIPNIFNNGELTVGENIADLGGVSCALEVAKKDENCDLKLFFETYAKIWSLAATRKVVYYNTLSNSHSLHKLRVNCVLQNLDDFYTTYGISENDGMYIPKEKRVSVW